MEGRETVESVGCVIEGVWLSVGGFGRHFEGGKVEVRPLVDALLSGIEAEGKLSGETRRVFYALKRIGIGRFVEMLQ